MVALVEDPSLVVQRVAVTHCVTPEIVKNLQVGWRFVLNSYFSSQVMRVLYWFTV